MVTMRKVIQNYKVITKHMFYTTFIPTLQGSRTEL